MMKNNASARYKGRPDTFRTDLVYFWPSATFFVFNVKFTVLKLSKPLTTTSHDLTISFYKQSMRLSCRFLQIQEVNQKFGSKFDIFAHKRIYYTDKNPLIFQGYVVDRCPTLRQ